MDIEKNWYQYTYRELKNTNKRQRAMSIAIQEKY
jgi:hypothetical protein